MFSIAIDYWEDSTVSIPHAHRHSCQIAVVVTRPDSHCHNFFNFHLDFLERDYIAECVCGVAYCPVGDIDNGFSIFTRMRKDRRDWLSPFEHVK